MSDPDVKMSAPQLQTFRRKLVPNVAPEQACVYRCNLQVSAAAIPPDDPSSMHGAGPRHSTRQASQEAI